MSSLSYLHVPQAQALSYLRSPQTRTFFLPLLLLPLLIPAPAFAALPDNRAYELVSPIEKGGVSNLANLVVTDAAGEHVIVDGGSKNAALASAASWMLETRTPTGWSGAQIGPAPTPEATFVEQTQVSLNSVSEDFSRFAFQSRMAHDPRDNTQGMGEYLREGVGGPFVWATGPPAPAVPVSEPGECENGITVSGECTTNKAVFAGASKDLRDLVWGEYHPLLEPPAALPGYPADTHQQGYEVYESVAGADELVGLVPGGSEVECGPSSGRCAVPPCGAAMGNEGGEYVTFTPEFAITPGFAPVAGAVSGDGDQVVFTSPDPVPYKEPETACTPPEIYIRVNGTTTVRVSASAKAGGDPNGPKEKVYAGSSEEGGRLNTVFFTSQEALTEDADTGGSDQGEDLYAYTLAAGAQPPKLVDLTPTNNTAGPKGGVEVTLLASSTDGKLVYFTASSALTAEPNSQGQTATPGASNLYVYHATSGHTTFIAPGAGLKARRTGLSRGFAPSALRLTSEVTPDGGRLVFVSTERLTDYNNFGPECVGGFSEAHGAQRGPGKCSEVYLYTIATNALICVSCNPTGAPPSGGARLPEAFPEGYGSSSLEPGTLPPPKAITDAGGHVFFSSPDQLTGEAPSPTTTIGPQAPIATNWELEPNVYEYEGGTTHLIAPSAVLLTTTASGKDVLFDTYSQFSPQDKDGSADVYDARVDGGFPVLAPPACAGTSCQGTPAAPTTFATPPSTTFTGVGNFPVPSSAPAKPKTAAQVRAEKLAKALKICRSKYPHKKRSRASCEAKARRTYKLAQRHERANHNGRASG